MSYSPGSNTANFNNCADWNGQDGNATTVGSNGGPSYYGTYDQTGLLWEWNEAVLDSFRQLRGGAWYNNSFNPNYLSSSYPITLAPSHESSPGFRLSSSSTVLNPLNLPYFVNVGDVGNNADTGGAGSEDLGSVNYTYQISQYLVTNCEYVAFLNAAASTDTYGLYNTSMSSDPKGGIDRSGSSGSYAYTIKTNMSNKPVIYVSWFDAARYCNWLHNGRGNASTETGAYTLNGATTGVSIVRNPNASYSIPTENEWYKAAYYKGGSQNAGYWTYATQSDSDPTCISADPNNGNGPESSSYICSYEAATPTPTPTTTITNTPTPNPTPPPTRTPTTTPTNTITSSPTASPTQTFTSTPTNTPTSTDTPTPTPTLTPTNTNTPTITSTQTPTASITPTPTSTLAECTLRDVQVAISDDMLYNKISCRRAETIKFIMAGAGCCGESNVIVVNVPSRTPTNTPTPTPTQTSTQTPTPTQTSTQTPTTTPTPTNTKTPTQTTTPTRSNTPTPTNTPTNTSTPNPTPSPNPFNIIWSTIHAGTIDGNPWVISNNNRTIRYNVEDSQNCGGSNNNTQTRTATATIITGSQNVNMQINFEGIGEAELPNYELIDFKLNGNIIASAHAPGGNKGCEMGPIVKSSDIIPPITLLAGQTYIFQIIFTTADPLYHVGAYYQIDLSFS